MLCSSTRSFYFPFGCPVVRKKGATARGCLCFAASRFAPGHRAFWSNYSERAVKVRSQGLPGLSFSEKSPV